MDNLMKTKKSMPPDWTPPAPAWAADFSATAGTVVMAYFGTQLRSNSSDHYAVLGKFLNAEDGPVNVEHAKFADRSGVDTIITAAYWRDPSDYDLWFKSSGFGKWWNDAARVNEPNGRFLEILKLPTDHFETIFSTATDKLGAGKIAGATAGPIREHNYWGSMRDRIPKSASDELASPYGMTLPRLGRSATEGKRLRITVPENLTIIRSGQDWSDCDDREYATYNESIRPSLNEAMGFLRDHPNETGCCELRFANETDAEGAPIKRSFGLGYFLTLAHLEKWASSHPTHLAIFKRFIDMVLQRKFDVRLRLWHEVSVLPAADQFFEYVNCHPDSGLLFISHQRATVDDPAMRVHSLIRLPRMRIVGTLCKDAHASRVPFVPFSSQFLSS